MTDIFGSLAQAKQEVNFLRVRNLQLKINMEQCVRNQLKEFPIHEVDQIITSIENVLKPTDSMENFYAEKLKKLTSRVGGLKMTKVGDKKCLCDCTGEYNDIVEDLAKHGGVDILTLLSTLGFIGSGGALAWIALAVKLGTKNGFGASTRKSLANWVQESLHEHNLLDYTRVDTMQSAFLWYFLVYKPETFETVKDDIQSIDDDLFKTRKEILLGKENYTIQNNNKIQKTNIISFIIFLQNTIFNNTYSIEQKVLQWELLITNKFLQDPGIKDKAKIISNLYFGGPWKNIEKNFKKALWFGIDANDIVELNGLLCLNNYDSFNKNDEREFKKLIQNLNYFNFLHPPESVKGYYGRLLDNELKNISYKYNNTTKEYLDLYYIILQNLPNTITTNDKTLPDLIKTLTNRYLLREYTSENLKDEKGLQLTLTHILNLNEWNDQFKLKHANLEKFSDDFYIFLKTQLNTDFDKLLNNLDELKLKIYKQKSEFSTLFKLEQHYLLEIDKTIRNNYPMAQLFLQYRYLYDKKLDEKVKEGFFTNGNFEFFYSEYIKNKVYSDLFDKNLQEQVFKEFDY